MAVKNDVLAQQFKSVEMYCTTNDVALFTGEIQTNNGSEILWTASTNASDNPELYLAALRQTGAKLLVASVEENDFDGQEDEVSDVLDILDGEALERFQTALREATKHKGHIAHFTLTFFYEGVAYQFQSFAPWVDHYFEVLEVLTDLEEKEEDVAPGMDETELEGIVRKTILENAEYRTGKDRFQRSDIATRLLHAAGIQNPTDVFRAVRKAEYLYDKEVLPAAEAEVRRQVQELKAKGHKKVEVRAKLGLTESQLNKHWY